MVNVKYMIVGLIILICSLSMYGQNEIDIKSYYAAAQKGDPEAQYTIAYCLLTGEYGVTQNISEGMKWLIASADQGYDVALMHLGVCYMKGDNIGIDETRGLSLIERSASLGNAQALYNIGEYNSMRNDFASAYKYYKQSSDRGNAQAMFRLGQMYFSGIVVEKDIKKATAYFESSANIGCEDAQISLMNAYFWGDDHNLFPLNYAKAYYWADILASKENPVGLYTLSLCFRFGYGTTKNELKAFDLMNKSAALGFADACGQLSEMYRYGIGTEKNPDESFRWALICYQAGGSSYQLAYCYLEGIGTSKNLQKARNYATELKESGYGILSRIYSADGPMQDKAKAIDYANKDIECFSKNFNMDLDSNVLALLSRYYYKGLTCLKFNLIEDAKDVCDVIYGYSPEYKEDGENRLFSYFYGAETNIYENEQVERFKNKPSPKSDVDINIPDCKNYVNANTFAVIIGNESYYNLSDVEFANSDAVVFAEYCNKVLSIPSENIRLYQDATYGQMINAIDDIKNIAIAYNGEIKILFYYAGHGFPGEGDGVSYLLPVDGNAINTNLAIPLNGLYSQLVETGARDVLVLLDACFSGTNRGDGMLLSARSVAIAPKQNKIPGNIKVMSACSGAEMALPYTEKAHGLFTYYILKKLQESGGKITLAELSDYVVDNVKKQSIITNRKLQTPTLFGNGNKSLDYNWFYTNDCK